MKLKMNATSWHSWLGVVLALPFLIVGLTAILIAHEKSLGTKQLMVNVSWLPAYSSQGRAHSQQQELQELRAYLPLPDGSAYVATKAGLVHVQGAERKVLLQGQDLRALVLCGDTLLVGGKNGIWRQAPDQPFEKVLDKADVHGLSVDAQGRCRAMLAKQGMRLSADGGRSWQADKSLQQSMASLSLPPAEAVAEIPLKDLVLDLHTGKALLGKQGEWIWIDLLGGVLLLLSGTGTWMWYYRRRKRFGKALSSKQAAEQPMPRPRPKRAVS